MPYRPGIANPAALSAPGWLEVELGVARTRQAQAETGRALSYTLKLALTPAWGVRIDGDGWLRNVDGGLVTQGGGDTSVIVKHYVGLSASSALGFEGGLSLPTARTGLGSGGTDVLLNAIFSADVSDDWHLDLNLAGRRYGAATPGTGRLEPSWAASLSRTIGAHWSVGAELAGSRRSGNPGTSQWLASASYASSPSVVWDFGLSRSMGPAPATWTAFAGITFVVGRLF